MKNQTTYRIIQDNLLSVTTRTYKDIAKAMKDLAIMFEQGNDDCIILQELNNGVKKRELMRHEFGKLNFNNR